HRHDAAAVGQARGERRAADRELHRRRRHVHEPARARAALHASETGAGLRTAELVCALRPARGSGREDELLARVRRLQGVGGCAIRVRRHVVRHAGAQGPQRRRRDGGSERMIITTLMQAVAQTTTSSNGVEHLVPPASTGFWFLMTVVKMLVLFTIYMVGVMMVIWAERRICAFIQDRRGPNRVGPHGLLQSVADGVKNIMKEETYPGAAYTPLFVLAPTIALIPALLTWAVIPYGAPWDSPWGTIDMALAPMPIGFLFTLAISSLGIYGIVLAGWASNNKYALLGGLRSSAQMLSYEISMG